MATADRRDVMKLGVLGGVAGLLGISGEAIAQETGGEADVEGCCVYAGPLTNGTPAKTAETGCSYLYVEYTGNSGPGAWWFTSRNDADWELLHLTTQEVRLEDRTDGTAPEIGLVNEGETLYKVTYA